MKDNLVVQPSVTALIARAHSALGTSATILFHRSGQILAKNGTIPEEDYPTVAVLVAGMVAAGQSLSRLMGENQDADYQLSHGTSGGGLYAVRINEDFWVFAVYREVLNPGLFRMQMRRLAHEVADHLKAPEGWLTEDIQMSGPTVRRGDTEPKASFDSVVDKGAKTPPPEKNGPKLFENITDEEIDQLFDT